jgi:hypothetical protein
VVWMRGLRCNTRTYSGCGKVMEEGIDPNPYGLLLRGRSHTSRPQEQK